MNVILNILTAICVAMLVVACGSGGGDSIEAVGDGNVFNINDSNVNGEIANNQQESDTTEDACLSCLMNGNDGVSDCTCLRQKGLTLAECNSKGVNGFADEEDCL